MFLIQIYKNVKTFFGRIWESYTNPSESKRIKSFEIFGLTNQIHDMNLLKNILQIESMIQIIQKQVYKSNQ
jgi:hypothetical protein